LGGGSPLLWLLFLSARSGCKYLLVRTAKGRRKEETKGVPLETTYVAKMDGHEQYGCLTNRQPSTWAPTVTASCLRKVKTLIFWVETSKLYIHREFSGVIKIGLWFSIMYPFLSLSLCQYYFIATITLPLTCCMNVPYMIYTYLYSTCASILYKTLLLTYLYFPNISQILILLLKNCLCVKFAYLRN
jgi:hypothetical protein